MRSSADTETGKQKSQEKPSECCKQENRSGGNPKSIGLNVYGDLCQRKQ